MLVSCLQKLKCSVCILLLTLPQWPLTAVRMVLGQFLLENVIRTAIVHNSVMNTRCGFHILLYLCWQSRSSKDFLNSLAWLGSSRKIDFSILYPMMIYWGTSYTFKMLQLTYACCIQRHLFPELFVPCSLTCMGSSCFTPSTEPGKCLK